MDLTTSLGKLSLKNPLICASSEFTMTAAGMKAAIDAGAGAVIAKSVNESPAAARQLDTAEYVLLDENWHVIPWESSPPENASLFCRSGLAKTPLKEWLKILAELDTYARERNSYVVGSITVAEPGPAAEIATKMEAAGLRWIELNLSAPHGREAASGAVRQITGADIVTDYVSQVRKATSLPLAVKLTAQTEDVLPLARRALESGADMLVMIGRFPGFIPHIESQVPVLGSWAAIGGHWSLPTSLYWVSKCWRTLPHNIPLIGTNGARNGEDVIRFILSGASAVEFASLLLMRGPVVFREMLDFLNNYGARKNLGRISDILGKAADATAIYGELPAISRTSYPWDKFIS